MKRLQRVTTLLCELMSDIHIPYIRQTDTRGEHQRSQDNPSMTPWQGIRIKTPRLDSQIPEVTDSRRKCGRRARNASVYKEIAENTYLRVPYNPSLYQIEVR